MSHSLDRTFHPAGHGAFYSEKHRVDDKSFNIVYDCGSRSKTIINNAISKAFSSTDVIDILFISHLHYDHISGIGELRRSVKSINLVVMPLLSPDEKNFLININRIYSTGIINLIRSPETFFGNETKIVYVKASDEDLENDRSDNIINIDNLGNLPNEIDSGTILRFRTINSWDFIPYNTDSKTRRNKLILKLTNAKINYKKLINSPNYTLNMLRTDIKKLKKAYDTIKGSLNDNSMLLYSGTDNLNYYYDLVAYSQNIIQATMFIYNNKPLHSYVIRSGCIYTGDNDLNNLKLSLIYKNQKKNISIIQIPHHGSKNNFCLATLHDFPVIYCPISCSKKNSRGYHPNPQVIDTLVVCNIKPLLITEDSWVIFQYSL